MGMQIKKYLMEIKHKVKVGHIENMQHYNESLYVTVYQNEECLFKYKAKFQIIIIYQRNIHVRINK